MPQKTTEVDPNLQKLVEHLAAKKKESSELRTTNGAVPWMRPPLWDNATQTGWDGDLQTEQGLIDLHEAFNTDEAEEKLAEAFDPDPTTDPGNSSDGIVLTLMIDYAAQAERALRARHQTFPRAIAHCANREKGHGGDTGPLTGASSGYFTSIIKQGAEDTPPPPTTGGGTTPPPTTGGGTTPPPILV
tara:strand:+ start:29872 stop:30435 length:564 start_codon:yes stop_codon:yes gene_type:complete